MIDSNGFPSTELSISSIDSEIENLKQNLSKTQKKHENLAQEKLYNLQLTSKTVSNCKSNLEKAKTELKNLKQNLSSISSSNISHHSLSDLLKLQNFRINIKKLIFQIDFIKSLPVLLDQATKSFIEQTQNFNSANYNLLSPFQHWMKLFFLFQNLSLDLKSQSDLNRIKRLRENVQKSEEEIWSAVFGPLSRCSELMSNGQIYSRILLNSFLIVESYEVQLKIQKIELAGKGNLDAESGFGLGINEKRRKTVDIVRKEVSDLIEKLFDSDNSLKGVIESGTRVIEAKINIFPSYLKYVDFIRKEFEPRLVEKLQIFLSEEFSFSGDEILELISFLGTYIQITQNSDFEFINSEDLQIEEKILEMENVQQVLKIHEGDLKAILFDLQVDEIYLNNISNFCSTLMKKYIKTAVKRLDGFISNLLNLENSVYDFFNLISNEIKVIKNKKINIILLNEFIKKVCFDSIKIYCYKSVDKLKGEIFEKKSLDKTLEIIYSYINNFEVGYSLCETTIKNEILNIFPNSESSETENIVKIFEEEIILEFINCLNLGSKFYSEAIINSFQKENIFEQLFSFGFRAHDKKISFILDTIKTSISNHKIKEERNLGKLIANLYKSLSFIYTKYIILFIFQALQNGKVSSEEFNPTHFYISKDIERIKSAFLPYLSLMKYGKIYGKNAFNQILVVSNIISRFINPSAADDGDLLTSFEENVKVLKPLLTKNEKLNQKIIQGLTSASVIRRVLAKDIGQTVARFSRAYTEYTSLGKLEFSPQEEKFILSFK
eukprot:snap_masked-scaffold_37-processed-gene-1.3-mRNA-1 protein AED:1.00 eAED:1.00 QI:0/0/0/0/1/1/2/0/777